MVDRKQGYQFYIKNIEFFLAAVNTFPRIIGGLFKGLLSLKLLNFKVNFRFRKESLRIMCPIPKHFFNL